MAPLLLVITLLSVSGTFVVSASEKSACDQMPSNGTCLQFGCNQQPCSVICGKMSPYERCEQQCNGSTCTSMICSASVQSCLQRCPYGSVCQSFDCKARQACFQTCSGGDCGEMSCNNEDTTSCEQTGGKLMSCHSSKLCQQICPSGKKCNMTCSSNVEECAQTCEGECFYQCAAQKCQLTCDRGNCTKIESPTTPTSSTGAPLQVEILLTAVLSLILAFVNFL